MILSTIWIYTIASVFIISLISLIGIITISIRTQKLKKILIYLISFSAGTLLGDAFIHLIPEIVENSKSINFSIYILFGIILFFTLEKILSWRHCHDPTCEKHIHNFAYMNLIGDAFHNLLDGIIIAASYMLSIPLGIATTIAVAFHEIPQEIGDFGVLLHGGFSKTKALAVNFLSAIFAIAGAIIALTLGSKIANFEIILAAIAAGGFIYIASADLIPEIHKHPSKISQSILQLLIFLLGILTMYLLLFLE